LPVSKDCICIEFNLLFNTHINP